MWVLRKAFIKFSNPSFYSVLNILKASERRLLTYAGPLWLSLNTFELSVRFYWQLRIFVCLLGILFLTVTNRYGIPKANRYLVHDKEIHVKSWKFKLILLYLLWMLLFIFMVSFRDKLTHVLLVSPFFALT